MCLELSLTFWKDCQELFGCQAVMDKALRDVVGALRIGRPHLGIFTAEKGLLAGTRKRSPQGDIDV